MKQLDESHQSEGRSRPPQLAAWLLVPGLLLITFLELHQFHFFARRPSAPRLTNEVFLSLPRGEHKEFVLPDGTRVWLNAASTLKYSNGFGKDCRTVELSGEAFFNVAPSAAFPFLVKMRNVEVQVLGTRFDLRNYPEEPICKVLVADGAVKVTHGDDQTVLHAGDRADVEVSSIRNPVMRITSGVDTGNASSWTKGLLEFQNEDLATVLRDLSRAYDVDIFLDGDIPEERFYGTFSMQEPLDEIMRRLDFHGLHVTVRHKSDRKVTNSLRK
jgi:transmembrane sensor